jgi:hypothetical protein
MILTWMQIYGDFNPEWMGFRGHPWITMTPAITADRPKLASSIAESETSLGQPRDPPTVAANVAMQVVP